MNIMRKIFISLLALIFIVLTILLNSLEPNGVAILEYHTITSTPDEDGERYNVYPNDFSAQLDYLQDNGYNTITIEDFVRSTRGEFELPDKAIILTFDDGYADNYQNMLPILQAHNMKAVVYIIANELGKPGYLTVEQVLDLQKQGIEIGNHTANHRPLIGLSESELNHEIRDSKLYLEYLGIYNVDNFSYPNGLYNDDVMAVLKNNSYHSAVTGDAGLNNADTDLLKLQRINIPQPRLGITEFKLRLLKGILFSKLEINQHRIK